MKYILKIFSDFCDEKTSIKTMTDIAIHKLKNYGKNNEIYITDKEDYTHVIIWNVAMPKLREDITKDKVIGLAYEPLVYLRLTNAFVEYAKKYIGKYYIGDKRGLPEPFIESNAYLIYNSPQASIPIKNKLMSIMVSQKNDQPGHQYRHMLVKNILHNRLPIDIYGRGCQYYKRSMDLSDSRVKGNFERYEMYDGYKFHICIENVRSNHYFSEKIINTLLTNTTPIYLGCNNIDKYFPNDVINLSGDLRKDLEMIIHILQNPNDYIKQINVDEIENKVNLLKNLEILFN